MSVTAASTLTFDRFFQELGNVAVEFVRIDREIEALFQKPSINTAFDLSAKVIMPLSCITAGCVLGTAFGIYLFAVSLFLNTLVLIAIRDNPELIRELPSINDYFSKENGLRNITLGLAAWFPLEFLTEMLVGLIEKIFILLGHPLSGVQDIGLLLSSGGLGGLLWMFIGCIIAPVGEEIIFRGWLTDLLKESEDPSSWNRFVTAVKTNAIFGALHVSPFQGWFNIPIFAATFIMGMCFSLLKELTGSLWAPMTCHMAGNMISTAILRY